MHRREESDHGGGQRLAAAVVARGMGKGPAAGGPEPSAVDYGSGTMSIGSRTFKTGDSSSPSTDRWARSLGRAA